MSKNKVKKSDFVKDLQIKIDKVIPDGYKGEIRTDNMSVYKKDANKFFNIFSKQLDVFKKKLKIKGKKKK